MLIVMMIVQNMQLNGGRMESFFFLELVAYKFKPVRATFCEAL